MIKEWKNSGLLKPSAIKPIFVTVEKSLLLTKLGRLGNEDRELLQKTLKSLLGQ